MVDSPWVFTLVQNGGSLTWIHHFWFCDDAMPRNTQCQLDSESRKYQQHVLVTWGLTSRLRFQIQYTLINKLLPIHFKVSKSWPHQAWDHPCFIHASNGRCAKGAATTGEAGEPIRPNTVASPGKPSNGIVWKPFLLFFLRRAFRFGTLSHHPKPYRVWWILFLVRDDKNHIRLEDILDKQ